MIRQLTFTLKLLTVITSIVMFSTPANAGRVGREIRRSIRREIRDAQFDDIREAICADATGKFRKKCKRARKIDRRIDRIRRRNNKRRIIKKILD